MRHTPAQLFTQWKRAALIKDRTRRAIRDRRQAGESLVSMARDYDVPVEFIRALCDWQLFGDEDDDGPEAQDNTPSLVRYPGSGPIK